MTVIIISINDKILTIVMELYQGSNDVEGERRVVGRVSVIWERKGVWERISLKCWSMWGFFPQEEKGSISFHLDSMWKDTKFEKYLKNSSSLDN